MLGLVKALIEALLKNKKLIINGNYSGAFQCYFSTIRKLCELSTKQDLNRSEPTKLFTPVEKCNKRLIICYLYNHSAKVLSLN